MILQLSLAKSVALSYIVIPTVARCSEKLSPMLFPVKHVLIFSFLSTSANKNFYYELQLATIFNLLK